MCGTAESSARKTVPLWGLWQPIKLVWKTGQDPYPRFKGQLNIECCADHSAGDMLVAICLGSQISNQGGGGCVDTVVVVRVEQKKY